MKNTKYLKYQENKITKEKLNSESRKERKNTKYLKYQENKVIKVKLNCFGEKAFL